MKDKRKEVILWVKALMGEVEGTDLEIADYNDIMTEESIDEFKDESFEVKWGLEEGAIRMLRKIFDIKDEEIDGVEK